MGTRTPNRPPNEPAAGGDATESICEPEKRHPRIYGACQEEGKGKRIMKKARSSVFSTVNYPTYRPCLLHNSFLRRISMYLLTAHFSIFSRSTFNAVLYYEAIVKHACGIAIIYISMCYNTTSWQEKGL